MLNCPVCKSPLEPVATSTGSCSICGSVFLKDLPPQDPASDSGDSAAAADPKPVNLGKTAFDNRKIDATIESGFVSLDSPPPVPVPAPPAPGKTGRTVSGLDQTIDSTSLPLSQGHQTVGGLDKTIDSTSLPPGGIGRTTGGLDKTIDSTSLPPGGIGRTAGGLDQTLDSASLPPRGVGRGTVGGTDRTLDSTGLRAGSSDQTIDSTPLPDEGVGRVVEPGAMTRGEIDRLTRMWSDQISPQAGAGSSLKAGGPKTHKDSRLVIKKRALRTQREVPSRESDYELLETIGEGGMGVVYAARQASIDRTVAIKMLKPDNSRNSDQREKFLSEAVVTGDLDHPNIVPIYDLGANESGALFYSMKRVEGTPWSKVLASKSLSENIEILMKVADAVGFAHARGVMHRDIKPENTMLGEFGEVLVMDWGLALSTAAFRKAGSISQTSSMGGTPAYMAPEMASGPLERIGPTSDIYLLGAVLFEIISGRQPHTGTSVMKCLLAAAQNEIVPVDQSGELMSIAHVAMATKPADRYQSVRDFQNAIRQYQSHSESIVLSARAEDDLRRAETSGDYQTFARAMFGFQEAQALWQDNKRAAVGLSAARLAYARQALVKADFDLGLSLLDAEDPLHRSLREELTAGQRERDARQQRLKNAKRVVTGLAAAMAIVVTGALVVINREKDRALVAEGEAKEQRDIAVVAEGRARESEQEAMQSAEREKFAAGREKIAAEQARQAETQAREAESQARRDRDRAQEARNNEEYAAYVARIGLIAAKVDENAFDKALQLLEECKADFRNWEWGRLKYLCGQSVRNYDAQAPVDAVALFPGDRRFVSGSWDGQVRIWNLDSGQVERTIPYGSLYVHGVAVSPDGKLVAAVGNDPAGYVKVWNADTGELTQSLVGHTDSVLSAVFSRDGKLLLTSSYDKTARLWDVASGRQVQLFRGHTWWVWSAAFSPDENRVVTAGQDGKVIVWRTATGEAGPPFTGHTGPVYSASFSPDGRLVASGGYDKRVLVWDPNEVRPFDFEKVFSAAPNPPLSFRELAGHAAAVRTVRFSADGRRLASGGHDNTLIVWDALRGKLLKTLRGHAGWVRSVAFSADGDWALSGSHDHLVKLWNIEGYEEQRVLRARLLEGHADAVLAAHFSPDGKSVVTASRDRTAKTWSVETGRELHSFEEGHEFLASTAIFFPGGKQVLTAAADNTARVWDVSTGSQVLRLDHTGRSAAAAVSHDGQFVLTGGDDKRARLWDAKTGELVRTLPPCKADVTAVAFSPDDQVLLVGDAAGHCELLNQADGKPLRQLEGHSGRIIAAAFVPNSRRLLTASSDKTVGQWNLDTGREESALVLRHPDALTAMALSPDGHHVVTLCDDAQVRVWDIDKAQAIKTIRPAGGRPDSLSLSPDGRHALIVNSRERLVRQWDLASGRPVPGPSRSGALVEQKSGQIWTAVYSPDANFVLTVGGNTARMWELGTGQPGISFSPHGAVAAANFSPDGLRLVTASWDNSAKIWDATTGQAIGKLEGAHDSYVNDAVFSPDGTLVLTASDDHLATLWNAEAREVLANLTGHADRVRSAAFSVDGARAVTASSDKTARIWDVASRQTLQVLKGHAWGVLCAEFSRDGKHVITGSEDNTAKIWDAQSGEALVSLQGHTASINWVAFSPDGRRALTASQDNTAKIWDAQTGKELLTLRGHTQEVTAAEFSPDDGLSALTASRDGTAIIWLGVDWRGDAQPAASPQSADNAEPAALDAVEEER